MIERAILLGGSHNIKRVAGDIDDGSAGDPDLGQMSLAFTSVGDRVVIPASGFRKLTCHSGAGVGESASKA